MVVVGAGANTRHMGDALLRLSGMHPLHVFEVGEPQIPVSPENLHLIHTPEGRESSQRLLGSGAVHAVYISLVPSRHLAALDEHLGHVGDGNVDIIVVAKPAVQGLDDMRKVDKRKKEAEERLRLRFGSDFKPEENPILYIHEHYKFKGAWHTLREQLGEGEVTDRLGRLRSVTIDIQEARTVEDEDRIAAFEGGALEDFGPHVISLGLDVRSSINKTERYTIPDHSETLIERFRYEGSDLPAGVETGFVVHGNTKIIDKNNKSEDYDLDFIWRGGKGAVNKKEAVLVFEHPDTGERTVITVDLRNNILAVPDTVRDLFPVTEFDDNGYGYVVEVGLNGGNPKESFQSWDEARIVTKWTHQLARQNSPLNIYPRGTSLEQLESNPFKSQPAV